MPQRVTTRLFATYRELETELKRYLPGYEKTKRYFKRIKLYQYLSTNGSLDLARRNSEHLCEIAKREASESQKWLMPVINRLKKTLPSVPVVFYDYLPTSPPSQANTSTCKSGIKSFTTVGVGAVYKHIPANITTISPSGYSLLDRLLQ